MKRFIDTGKWFLIAVILGLTSIAGCRAVRVELPSESPGGKPRVITYINFGFDTKMGNLEIESSTGSKLRLENLDGSSQGLATVGKALDKIPSRP